MLLDVLAELDPQEKKQFLLFATGSTRLPYGGFKALMPHLTCVKKHTHGYPPDQYLPSVMTCQNYLKMPEYSSKDILKERLLYAMKEG